MSASPSAARGHWWREPRIRGFIWQGLALAIAVGILVLLVATAQENIAKQRIATGFGFFDDEANFAIIQTLIPYSETSTYARALLVGLINTLLVATLGIVLASVIGFAVGIARLSPNWLVARLAAIYVETLRNVPLLLQLFFWYFAVLRALPRPAASLSIGDAVFLNNRGLFVPALSFEGMAWLAPVVLVMMVLASRVVSTRTRAGTRWLDRWPRAGLIAFGVLCAVGILAFTVQAEVPALTGFSFRGGVRVIPELMALVIGLSTYTAAFIAEIVRSGIQGVEKGQHEAAQSLGLSRWQTLRLVVMPQALRIIVPPLTSQYLNLTKNSSLGTAIAYPDLVHVFAGTALNQTGQAVEILTVTMAIYLTLSLLTAAAMNWYNSRLRLQER